MTKISKQVSTHDDYGPVEAWHDEVDGYNVEFIRFKEDTETTALLKGLPNDECICPHWGYVLQGAVTFTVDGRDETYGPGDAFYIAPGHGQRAAADTEYLQFSPAAEMAVVQAQIMKNFAALQSQS